MRSEEVKEHGNDFILSNVILCDGGAMTLSTKIFMLKFGSFLFLLGLLFYFLTFIHYSFFFPYSFLKVLNSFILLLRHFCGKF